MTPFIKTLNFCRNVKGRFDLMRFLFKWDVDYKKDLTVTALTFALLSYSILTWNTGYDLIALIIEAGIILVVMGTELSILPVDYRPSYNGVVYSAQISRHIAYDELSFLMSDVRAAKKEEELGFTHPSGIRNICPESALCSDKINDILMLKESMPYIETKKEVNYIRSRHQIRYIAIRVANKRQHTTNGVKLALEGLTDGLTGNRPSLVRKSYYFDALLTAEAFRSRIFRNNITREKEVYTDLTTYFPVELKNENGADVLRFTPDFYKKASGHIGITTLLITENNRVAMLHQGDSKAIGPNTVTLGGSGSMNYNDMFADKRQNDLRVPIAYAMARELCEETGMHARFKEIHQNTLVTGFFRWVDRCGKPEFTGITRAGGIPFSKKISIDGDEVIKFDEIPVTLQSLDDFIKVLAYIRDNNIKISLSSLMALHRMTVIADYNSPQTTPEQKKIHARMTNFIFK